MDAIWVYCKEELSHSEAALCRTVSFLKVFKPSLENVLLRDIVEKFIHHMQIE